MHASCPSHSKFRKPRFGHRKTLPLALVGSRLAVGLPFEIVFLVDLARLRTTQTGDGCFVASVVDWTTRIGAYILI